MRIGPYVILKSADLKNIINSKESLEKACENYKAAIETNNASNFSKLEEKDKHTEQLELEIKKKDEKIFEQGQAIERQAKVITKLNEIKEGLKEEIKKLRKEKGVLKSSNTRLKNSKKKKEKIVRDGREYIVTKEKDEKIPKGQKLKVKSGARTSKIIKDMKEGNE